MLKLSQSIIWIFIVIAALPQIAHARVYNPSTGRWMQRDPAGYVDGSNLYQYVRGEPIQSRDPTGLTSDEYNRNVPELDEYYMDQGNAYLIAVIASDYAMLDSAYLAWVASRATTKKFGEQDINGPANAWKHCYWSCLMSARHGHAVSKIIGDNHEKEGTENGQSDCDRAMDDNNNRVGRGIGQEYPKNGSNKQHCAAGCDDALADGSLYKSPDEACDDTEQCEKASDGD